jgi:ribonuclease HI
VKSYGDRDIEEFNARLADLSASLDIPPKAGEFVAYTDGACFGNPTGPGGWAAAVFAGAETWYLFGHLSSTSNNRAEALGVLGALKWVPPTSRLRLHSDSELTVRQLEGRYKIKANSDIWALIQSVRAEKRIDLLPEWVRGHAGDQRNELADRLSKLGALNGSLDELAALEAAPVVPPADPPELEGVVPKGDWERDFVTSIRDQLRRGRTLSPKQLAVLDRIRARGSGGRERSDAAPP